MDALKLHGLQSRGLCRDKTEGMLLESAQVVNRVGEFKGNGTKAYIPSSAICYCFYATHPISELMTQFSISTTLNNKISFYERTN